MKQNKFAVRRFRNWNGVTSWRVSGWSSLSMQPTRGRKGQFGLLFETQKANGINGVMAVIHLETVIAAPKGRVFDLARSIDAHQDSTGQTGERAVAGVTSASGGGDVVQDWPFKNRTASGVQDLDVKKPAAIGPSAMARCN
jgi:hypothetical protein